MSQMARTSGSPSSPARRWKSSGISAGPAAHVIDDWKVALPRPRDIAEVKTERAFQDLHREIWAVLKTEVLKGYAQTGGS